MNELSIIEAVEKYILSSMVESFGEVWALVVLIGIVVLFYAFRFYQQRSRQRKYEDALTAKDDTIERIARDLRIYKYLYHKQNTSQSKDELRELFLRPEDTIEWEDES